MCNYCDKDMKHFSNIQHLFHFFITDTWHSPFSWYHQLATMVPCHAMHSKKVMKFVTILPIFLEKLGVHFQNFRFYVEVVTIQRIFF